MPVCCIGVGLCVMQLIASLQQAALGTPPNRSLVAPLNDLIAVKVGVVAPVMAAKKSFQQDHLFPFRSPRITGQSTRTLRAGYLRVRPRRTPIVYRASLMNRHANGAAQIHAHRQSRSAMRLCSTAGKIECSNFQVSNKEVILNRYFSLSVSLLFSGGKPSSLLT